MGGCVDCRTKFFLCLPVGVSVYQSRAIADSHHQLYLGQGREIIPRSKPPAYGPSFHERLPESSRSSLIGHFPQTESARGVEKHIDISGLTGSTAVVALPFASCLSISVRLSLLSFGVSQLGCKSTEGLHPNEMRGLHARKGFSI